MDAWHLAVCIWSSLWAAVVLIGAFKFDGRTARIGAVLIASSILLCILGMVIR